MTRPDEYRTEYEDAETGVWQRLVVPVLKTTPRKALIEGSSLSRRSIERLLFGGTVRRASHRNFLIGLAKNYAAAYLGRAAISIQRETATVLHLYLPATESAASQ